MIPGAFVYPKWTTPDILRGTIIKSACDGHVRVRWLVRPCGQMIFEMRQKNRNLKDEDIPMLDGGTSIILIEQLRPMSPLNAGQPPHALVQLPERFR